MLPDDTTEVEGFRSGGGSFSDQIEVGRVRRVGLEGCIEGVKMKLLFLFYIFFKASSCHTVLCVLCWVGALNVFLRHDGSRPSMQSSVNCLISFSRQMADAASDA